jgi:hypothetical protein
MTKLKSLNGIWLFAAAGSFGHNGAQMQINCTRSRVKAQPDLEQLHHCAITGQKL